MTEQHRKNGSSLDYAAIPTEAAAEREVLHEEAFKRMISVERKRTERSAKPFLLMLLATGEQQSEEKNRQILAKVISALVDSTRETDVIGWHKKNACVGVMFTDLVIFDQKSILSQMLGRVGAILRDKLSSEQFSQISISFHFYPDKWDDDVSHRPSNPTLYPDLPRGDNLGKLFTLTKRVMDIGGSLMLLILCSPVLLIVAAAVKALVERPDLIPPAAHWAVRQAVYLSEVPVDVCGQRCQRTPRLRECN